MMIEIIRQNVRNLVEQALRDIGKAKTRDELTAINKAVRKEVTALNRLIWKLEMEARKK